MTRRKGTKPDRSAAVRKAWDTRRKKPTPPRITGTNCWLNITEEIIDSAIRKNSGACIYANAMRAQIKNVLRPAADVQSFRWTDKVKGLRYTLLTPRKAQHVLANWDIGIRPAPHRLRLRGATVTTAVKRRRGGPRNPVHNLGPRRLHVSYQDKHSGTIPAQVGGKAIPVLRGRDGGRHPSHHTRREFGVRQWIKDDLVPMGSEPITEQQAAEQITKAMKAQLLVQGFTSAQIEKFAPEKAQEILAQGKFAGGKYK